MQKLAALFVLVLFLLVIPVDAQQQPTGTLKSQSTGQASTQSLPDAELIKQAALDYIEGFYEGDAQRMERALHPELAKRIVRTDAQGRSNLGQMSAMTLVQITRSGDGKNIPKEKQQKDVTVLDIFGNAASAKIIASDWVDYLHLAKWRGRWVIVNVLWELKPQPAKQ